MTRLNDTIITRFPFSLEGRRAPRDRRGRWEDVCEMKSLLCWNKSGRRRALNHSDTNNKTTHIQEKTSRWSHQTGSGEGAGGFKQTVRVQLLFNATQTFNVLQQLHCLLVLKRRGTFSVEHNLYDASPKICLRHLGRVKCYTAVTFTKIPAADRRGKLFDYHNSCQFCVQLKTFHTGSARCAPGGRPGVETKQKKVETLSCCWQLHK